MHRVQYNEARQYEIGPQYGIYDPAPSPKHCPYCGAVSQAGSTPTKHGELPFHEKTLYVGFCHRCGWWWADFRDSEGFTHEAGRFFHAMLKKGALPEDAVGRALDQTRMILENNRDLFKLTPRDFEHLIAQVFVDLFDCEVALTKQTRDGGKDLVCFDSSRGEFIVEIKRHQEQRKVGVSIVRSLL